MSLRDAIRLPGGRPLDPLRADGRWARILRALADGPLDPADLTLAISPDCQSRWRERRRTVLALHAMAAQGWVKATHWGWARTADGLAALSALQDAPTPEQSQPETETA